MVIIDTNPVTWEYEGYVYNMIYPGIPLQKATGWKLAKAGKKPKVVGWIPAGYEETCAWEDAEILVGQSQAAYNGLCGMSKKDCKIKSTA